VVRHPRHSYVRPRTCLVQKVTCLFGERLVLTPGGSISETLSIVGPRDPMTNNGPPDLQVIVPVKELSPKPREWFTQEDRDAANQRLQDAFENERIKRARSPIQILQTGLPSSVLVPPGKMPR
jgi:hypothetical protein